MSNWVSCLVNFVVLFCLANTGGSSGGSGLAIKPSSKQTALKPGAIIKTTDQKTVKTHFVPPTPRPPGRFINPKRFYFAVIRIQYVNGKNENDQKILECGGTIVTQNEVLTDAGCFQDIYIQDPKKKSKTRKGVYDTSDILKLRGIKVEITHNNSGVWEQTVRDVSQVDVYRNQKSQETNQQINIAKVTMDSNDLVVKQLPVCRGSIVEDMLKNYRKELLIVGWKELRFNLIGSIDIKVKVKEKSKCKRKHTKRYGGPDTHCAFPRNTQDDMDEDIFTDRGGPVVWDGPDKCLVGVINDGDLSKMGRLNWFMKLFNINNNIIFTSLEEYAELSAKHEFEKIYPILKK